MKDLPSIELPSVVLWPDVSTVSVPHPSQPFFWGGALVFYVLFYSFVKWRTGRD